MSCKVKGEILDNFKNKGAIDPKTGSVVDFELFDKLNEQYTQLARDKYAVGTGRTLLFEVPLDSETYIPVPNDILLDTLDEAIENFNNHYIQDGGVNYKLKAVDILQSKKAKDIFKKGEKVGWGISKILTELQIPKAQKQIVVDLGITDRAEIVKALSSSSSFKVEVAEGTDTTPSQGLRKTISKEEYDSIDAEGDWSGDPDSGWSEIKEKDGVRYEAMQYFYEDKSETPIEYHKYNMIPNSTPTSHYSNMGVPGGTNYRESRIVTPKIVPVIKGHANFAEDTDIGWFRSDKADGKSVNKDLIKNIKDVPSEFTFDGDRIYKEFGEWYSNSFSISDQTALFRYNQSLGLINNSIPEDTKTRRVLEFQSDLFQRGRDKKNLTSDSKELGEKTVFEDGTTYFYYHEDRTFYKLQEDIELQEDSNGNTMPKTVYKEVEVPLKQVEATKTRNKGIYITNPIYNTKEANFRENSFLQLLNRKGQWINFFVQTIIQDSQRNGYENVLFPKGETAAKVEGHQVIADRIRDIDDAVSSLKVKLNKPLTKYYTESEKPYILEEDVDAAPFGGINSYTSIKEYKDSIRKRIKEKEEAKDALKSEGIEKLAPIEAFYEKRVTNILNKLYGKDAISEYTDGHGNSWNKVDLSKVPNAPIILEKRIEDLRTDESSTSIFDLKKASSKKERVNRDFSNDNHTILFDNKEAPKTAVGVLDNIVANFKGFSSHADALVDKAKLLVHRTGATVKIVDAKDLESSKTLMQYDASKNEIQIAPEKFVKASPNAVVEGFLHEVVHSITAKAYLEPGTMEEEMFKDFIDEMFAKYSASSSGSYGFESPMEFMAEIMTNKTFQEEVKQIDRKGIWDQIVDFIRTLFGLKVDSNYNDVIDSIISISSNQSYTGVTGISGNAIFQTQEETTERSMEAPRVSTLEEKSIDVADQAIDNLSQAHNRVLGNIKYKKTPEAQRASGEFAEHLDSLKNSMQAHEATEVWKALILYARSLEGTVTRLKDNLQKVNIKSKNAIEVMNNFEEYLSAYDMLGEIRTLYSEALNSYNDILTGEQIKDIETLKGIISEFESEQGDLVESLRVIRKNKFIEMISDKRFHQEVETKWRNRIQGEYVDLGIDPKQISKDEYVTQQMLGKYKKEMDKDVMAAAIDVVEAIDNDLSVAVGRLADPTNTNSSPLFNLGFSIVQQMRDRIVDRQLSIDRDLNPLFKEFVEEMGNSAPAKAFKNVVEQDKDGNYYLKSTYTAKFYQEVRDNLAPLESQLAELINEEKDLFHQENPLFEGELSYDEIMQGPDAQALQYQIDAWYKKHTVTEGRSVLPKAKYINDLTTLTKSEKAVLDKYKSILLASDEAHKGRASLIRKEFGSNFYKLSAISKTNMERALEGNVRGVLKDKVKDLTQIRTDDIGYSEEALGSDNKPLKNVRIHYRGHVDPNEQSLDLFTMMRMEMQSLVHYQEKTKEELVLNELVEIAENKEYIAKSPRNGKDLFNRFRERTPMARRKGGDSETARRLNSYIEANIYDVLNEDAGFTLLGGDVNKITKSVNGLTAFIGMSVNVASGAANLTNGFSQLMIEAVGGHHFSWKSLIKAEKMYTKELTNGAIMKDLVSPVKTSFTNQVTQYFDTYGGHNISNHPFFKNTIGRVVGSSEILSFMQNGGEHMMQSILTMAVLDGIKVMNKKGNFIDKDGKVVPEKEAASLLDSLKMKNNRLTISQNVFYTTHTRNIDIFEGGKAQINSLIKKKIHDLFGAYDPLNQNDLYKTWYGKLVMMFKRFMIPGLQYRYKGMDTVHKSREELENKDKLYSVALKEHEEGTYVTLLRTLGLTNTMKRFFTDGVMPTLKSLKFSYLKDNYSKLSDYEKANLHKATTEMVTTMGILPAIISMSTVENDDGEDSDYKWFLAYQLRRLDSELSQFYNLSEAWRITNNPIAGVRVIEGYMGLITTVFSPWNWFDETATGEYKAKNTVRKVTPIWVQTSKDWKRSYQYLENQAN